MNRQNNDLGYTLIEVMIAMTIFSYGMLAIASLLISSIEGNTNAAEVTDISSMATQRLELLMSLYYDPNNDSTTHNDIKDTDGDGSGGLSDTYSGTTITADNYIYYQ